MKNGRQIRGCRPSRLARDNPVYHVDRQRCCLGLDFACDPRLKRFITVNTTSASRGRSRVLRETQEMNLRVMK
jgi:hypothetical protein